MKEQSIARESPELAQISIFLDKKHMTQVVPLNVASIFELVSNLSCVKVKELLIY